eukprot:scaffold1275_cov154-Skeletonema_menzelii.AAC.8
MGRGAAITRERASREPSPGDHQAITPKDLRKASYIKAVDGGEGQTRPKRPSYSPNPAFPTYLLYSSIYL